MIKKSRYFIIIFIVGTISSCLPENKETTAIPGGADSAKLVTLEIEKANVFFENSFDLYLQRHPEEATTFGKKYNYDQWNDLSKEFEKQDLLIANQEIAFLTDSINYNLLDEKTKLSFDLFKARKLDFVRNSEFSSYNYPINQMYGKHTFIPEFLANKHNIDSLPDAVSYISRVQNSSSYLKYIIKGLEEREKNNIILPKFLFSKMVSSCENIIEGISLDEHKILNVIQGDFNSKIEALSLDDSIQFKLSSSLEQALIQELKPAYLELISFLQDQETRATNDCGVWKFPNGEQFYKNQLFNHTTTYLTPDEIFELGTKEVASIQEEMNLVRQKMNYNGTLNELFEFMRTDQQFYFHNTNEDRKIYLDSTKAIIASMRLKLSELFNTIPKAELVVKRVEKYREASAGGAFYYEPSEDGKIPGIYYVNLYRMDAMPIFEMEALAYHEAIPGHHMQLALAKEIEGLPSFRKNGEYYNAYIEGWALYCESLPKDIGFFQNPYSDLGRLSMELWRACRLVADVGIHVKKWTRQEAIDYYRSNTPAVMSECVKMVERHMVMPGQATSYKIGMNKIIELKEKAKNALGDQFDIRQFHDVILSNSQVPLTILESLVNNWIASLQPAA